MLAGGAPREILEGCYGADWTPDGQSLAVIRRNPTGTGGENHLEFPAGNAPQDEDLELAACRELSEETGYVLATDARMRLLGAYYSLPSETTVTSSPSLAPISPSSPGSTPAPLR